MLLLLLLVLFYLKNCYSAPICNFFPLLFEKSVTESCIVAQIWLMLPNIQVGLEVIAAQGATLSLGFLISKPVSLDTAEVESGQH